MLSVIALMNFLSLNPMNTSGGEADDSVFVASQMGLFHINGSKINEIRVPAETAIIAHQKSFPFVSKDRRYKGVGYRFDKEESLTVNSGVDTYISVFPLGEFRCTHYAGMNKNVEYIVNTDVKETAVYCLLSTSEDIGNMYVRIEKIGGSVEVSGLALNGSNHFLENITLKRVQQYDWKQTTTGLLVVNVGNSDVVYDIKYAQTDHEQGGSWAYVFDGNDIVFLDIDDIVRVASILVAAFGIVICIVILCCMAIKHYRNRKSKEGEEAGTYSYSSEDVESPQAPTYYGAPTYQPSPQVFQIGPSTQQVVVYATVQLPAAEAPRAAPEPVPAPPPEAQSKMLFPEALRDDSKEIQW